MLGIRSSIRRWPVLSYFILTFIISWGGLLLVVGLDGIPGTPDEFNRLLPMALLGLLGGPTLSGLVMTAIVDGTLGLRALGGRLIKWRTGIRWYALALLIAPMAMVVVPLAISAFYPAMMPRVFTSNDRASLFAIGIASGLLGGLLEELGWTGFATPQLLKRHGVLEAGLILGPIWALWHLPMNLWSSGDATGALATTLFLHSFLFSIGILTAYRILIVWVYQGTRSLLVAVLMHFALILGNLLFVPEAFDALPGPVWSLAVAATLWVMLAVVRVGRRAGRPAAGRPVAA